MTLDSTTSKVQYTQSGTTTAWPVPYKFLDNEDLIVITTVGGVDTTLVLDTDYTVTGAGDDDGGTVTISPAVATGTRVTIYREIDLDQPTELTTAGGWFPKVHEAVFDRLTMIDQQLQEQLDRAVKLSPSTTLDPDTVAEELFEARDDAQTAASEAEASAIRAELAATTVDYYNHEGTLTAGQDTITLPWAYDTSVGVEVFLSGVKQTESSLVFTDAFTVTLDTPVSADTPFEAVASSGARSDLSSTLAGPGGSSLVGFLQDGTGATARTVQAKLRDVVSVKDFGAVGDGVTDDTVAVHAFFDALAADGGVGYINKGTYICDPYSRDFASNPGVGFTVYGSGPMSTILKLKTHSNFLQWTNASGVHINGITVDCGYSTLPATGVYSHGITFSNCNDCSANNCHALDFSKTGFIAYTDSTVTGTIYSRVFFRNCYAKCSAAKAAGLDTNGVLISDNWYSGIENCIAEDITTYGIELKQNARYCHITGCTAKNVTAAGFAMGQTTVGIDGCDFNTVTDFISVGCAIGAMIGEGENNLINGLMVDFTGMTSAQQNSAVRLENCKNNTILNLATQNLGSYGVLFYSDGNPISGNFVQISNLSMCRAEYYAAGFNAASANNSVIVSNITDASGAVVLGNTVRFSAGGTLNKFFYQNDPRFIVGASGASSNSNAKLVLESGANTIFNLLAPSATVSGLTFSNPSSSSDGYIHYDNANRRLDIGVEASATYFRFQKVQFVPVPDNAVSLGSGSARWSTVYAGTGTISTSDEREKTFLPIESAETLVAKELKSCIKKFKFNDAIQLKGDNARLHFGIGAQTVASVFQSHGLDPSKYAMFCHDEWEEERDEDGSVIRPAGNRYGIRYDELLAFIISAI